MSKFVVAIFPDVQSAEDGVRVLRVLASEGAIELHGVGIVTRGSGGNLKTQVAVDELRGLVVTGAAMFGLAGLAVGPLEATVSAMAGAVFGAAAGLTNRGASMGFTLKVTKDLAPGLVAVIADVTSRDSESAIARLNAVGGTAARQ